MKICSLCVNTMHLYQDCVWAHSVHEKFVILLWVFISLYLFLSLRKKEKNFIHLIWLKISSQENVVFRFVNNIVACYLTGSSDRELETWN